MLFLDLVLILSFGISPQLSTFANLQIELERVIQSRGKIPSPKARRYAQLLIRYGTRYDIDPFLIAALIDRESRWNSRAVSGGNHGLMQLRVSKTTHAKWLGSESKLFNPELNIKLGVKLLAYWKRYHWQHCVHKSHYWWSHYQWGSVVNDSGSGNRVWEEYARYKSVKRDAYQGLW